MRGLVLVLFALGRAGAFTPTTKGELQDAVKAWLDDATTAEATYGHISSWNTGSITDMAWLFCAWAQDGNSTTFCSGRLVMFSNMKT